MSSARVAKPGPSSETALDIGFALCWLAIFYVLPPAAPMLAGIDPSWQAYLTEMFLRHAQFGGTLSSPMGHGDF